MNGNARSLRMYRADLVQQIKTARAGLEELPDLHRVELGSGENLGIFVERGPAPSKKSSATVDKGAGAGELVVESADSDKEEEKIAGTVDKGAGAGELVVESAVSDKEEEKIEGTVDKGAGAAELVVESAASDKEEEKIEGNIIDINIVYSDDDD